MLSKLEEFLSVHSEEYFSCTVKHINNGTSNMYGYLAQPYRLFNDEEQIEEEDIEEFIRGEKECEFTYGYDRYCLSVIEPNADKWGNIGDYEELRFVNPDCWEIYYSDLSYASWSDEFNFPEDLEDLEDEFEEWFFDNFEKYDFISCILIPETETGTHCLICRYTSNKKLDSAEWQGLFNDYRYYGQEE